MMILSFTCFWNLCVAVNCSRICVMQVGENFIINRLFCEFGTTFHVVLFLKY